MNKFTKHAAFGLILATMTMSVFAENNKYAYSINIGNVVAFKDESTHRLPDTYALTISDSTNAFYHFPSENAGVTYAKNLVKTISPVVVLDDYVERPREKVHYGNIIGPVNTQLRAEYKIDKVIPVPKDKFELITGKVNKDSIVKQDHTLHFKLNASEVVYEFTSDTNINAAHELLKSSLETDKEAITIGLLAEKAPDAKGKHRLMTFGSVSRGTLDPLP